MAIQNPFLGLLAQAQAQQRQQRFAREQANRQFGHSLLAALGGEIFRQAGKGVYEATSPVVEAQIKREKALADSIAFENEQRRRAAKAAEGATDIAFKEAVSVPMTQGEGLQALADTRAALRTAQRFQEGDVEAKGLEGFEPFSPEWEKAARREYQQAQQTIKKHPSLEVGLSEGPSLRAVSVPPGATPESLEKLEARLEREQDAHEAELIKGLKKIPEKYKGYTPEQKAAYIKARTTRRDTERQALLTALEVARHQGQYIDTDVDSEHWSDYIIGETLDKNKDLTQIQIDALKAKLKARRSSRYRKTGTYVDKFVKGLPRGIGKQAAKRFALTLYDNQNGIKIGNTVYTIKDAWENKQLRQAVLDGRATGTYKDYKDVSLTHDNEVVLDKILKMNVVYARSAKIAEMKEDAKVAAEIRKDLRDGKKVQQKRADSIKDKKLQALLKIVIKTAEYDPEGAKRQVDDLVNRTKAEVNEHELDTAPRVTPSRPAPQKSSLVSRMREAAFKLYGVPLGNKYIPADVRKKMQNEPGLHLYLTTGNPINLTREVKTGLGLQ